MNENASRNHSFLTVLAYVGQFAALFPFVTAFEVLGAGAFVVWHFPLFYGIWLFFWAVGILIGVLIRHMENRKKVSKKLLPFMYFLAKIGFLLPAAILITVCVWLSTEVAACFFALLGGIAIYYGGSLYVGRPYSEVFSKAWFMLYTVAAVTFTVLFSLSENNKAAPRGKFILCAGFAVIVLFSAVIINQANVDACTNQRDRGRTVLPWGLRRYNALLGVGVFVVALGLFAFAKPIAAFFRYVIGVLVRAFVYIMEFFDRDEPVSEPDTSLSEAENIGYNSPNDALFDFSFIILTVIIIVLLFIFREPIVTGIKNFFSFLFKKKNRGNNSPFADEITKSSVKSPSKRMKKKEERELERKYSRETSPNRRYRLGYALFLTRLSRTDAPPEPADTTDVHREKGESAFKEDLRGLSETYAMVRYAEAQPTEEELSAQNELLRRIRK